MTRRKTAEKPKVLDRTPRVTVERHLTLTLPNSRRSLYLLDYYYEDVSVTLTADEADVLAGELADSVADLRGYLARTT